MRITRYIKVSTLLGEYYNIFLSDKTIYCQIIAHRSTGITVMYGGEKIDLENSDIVKICTDVDTERLVAISMAIFSFITVLVLFFYYDFNIVSLTPFFGLIVFIGYAFWQQRIYFLLRPINTDLRGYSIIFIFISAFGLYMSLIDKNDRRLMLPLIASVIFALMSSLSIGTKMIDIGSNACHIMAVILLISILLEHYIMH